MSAAPVQYAKKQSSGIRGRFAYMLTIYAILVILSIVLLFPMWWMTVVSLETGAEASKAAASARGFAMVPDDPQFGNYPNALTQMGSDSHHPWRGFLDALANTVVITTLCVLGSVISCSLVGYAFARLRFRGREPMFILMISTMMLPPQVTMIPMFILFRYLGWIDSVLPLVVPMFFGNPFFIFMFRQFFMQLPYELTEAAKIDGASAVATFWRIMLPLTTPVIAIVAIYSFMFTWNDFLAPLIYLNSPSMRTLAVELNSFNGQYGVENRNLLLAASLITMLPCVVLFFAAQRYFVDQGATAGLKG